MIIFSNDTIAMPCKYINNNILHKNIEALYNVNSHLAQSMVASEFQSLPALNSGIQKGAAA